MIRIKEFTLQLGDKLMLDRISLSVAKGEILGIIGESGAGKSTLVNSLLRLYKGDASGEISLFGENILNSDEREMARLRKRVSLIFQNPSSHLDPSMRVGRQMSYYVKDVERQRELTSYLEIEECYNKYPHELSVGEKQRVLITIALSLSSEIVIADEPTSALDSRLRGKVKELFKQLKTTLIIVSHDLQLVRGLTDRAIVMRGGKILEEGNIFANPQEEYTKMLLRYLGEDYGNIRGS